MTQSIERGICFREHVLLIWELGAVIGMGGGGADLEGSNKQKPVAPPTSEGGDGGGKGAGEAVWLSPPSPSPRCFPRGCTGGSAGTLASPGRDWPVAVATAVINAWCLCLPPASLEPGSAQMS